MLTGSWVLNYFLVLSLIQLLLPVVVWVVRTYSGSKGVGDE